jgi:glutaredoxin
MTTVLYIELGLLLFLLLTFFKIKPFFKWLIKTFGYKWFYWHIYLHTPSWQLARFLKKLFNPKHCPHCRKYRSLDCHHLSYDHPWYEWLHLKDIALACRKCHHKEHPNYVRADWQQAWSK